MRAHLLGLIKASRLVRLRGLFRLEAPLLELLARLLLLIIFLALSFSPPRRTVVVEKLRIHLEAQVNTVRRYAHMPQAVAPRPRSFARNSLLRPRRAHAKTRFCTLF